MANDKQDTRGEPQLCRDYYGELFIVIDDDGEPVTDYYTAIADAIATRDNHSDGPGERPWAKYRIASVGLKALVPDDGSPVTIADDPRPGNTNCLEDLACPKCGRSESLRIEGSSVFVVTDDGTGEHGDVEWDGDSWTLCPACEFEGRHAEFRREKVE